MGKVSRRAFFLYTARSGARKRVMECAARTLQAVHGRPPNMECAVRTPRVRAGVVTMVPVKS